MSKPKKNTGNKDSNLDPISTSEKKHKETGQTISGHPESEGGSRQGNIGHEHSSETGRGDRQV
jgi:hypothetical protein